MTGYVRAAWSNVTFDGLPSHVLVTPNAVRTPVECGSSAARRAATAQVKNGLNAGNARKCCSAKMNRLVLTMNGGRTYKVAQRRAARYGAMARL